MLIIKILNSSKFWGFDMWYQSMVQTLGLDVAQLVSTGQKENVLTCILFYVKRIEKLIFMNLTGRYGEARRIC